jgi:hypothetical protein
MYLFKIIKVDKILLDTERCFSSNTANSTLHVLGLFWERRLRKYSEKGRCPLLHFTS